MSAPDMASELGAPAVVEGSGDDLAVAQAQYLLKRAPLGLFANAANAAIVGVVMAGVAPGAAYRWVALALLVTAGRAAVHLRQRRVAIAPDNVRACPTLQTVSAGVAGLCWSAGSLWIFPAPWRTRCCSPSRRPAAGGGDAPLPADGRSAAALRV